MTVTDVVCILLTVMLEIARSSDDRIFARSGGLLESVALPTK
jgi:hypothetical protein